MDLHKEARRRETSRSLQDRGAPGRDRTCDLRFRKPLLYPLSYGGGQCSDSSSEVAAVVRWNVREARNLLKGTGSGRVSELMQCRLHHRQLC